MKLITSDPYLSARVNSALKKGAKDRNRGAAKRKAALEVVGALESLVKNSNVKVGSGKARLTKTRKAIPRRSRTAKAKLKSTRDDVSTEGSSADEDDQVQSDGEEEDEDEDEDECTNCSEEEGDQSSRAGDDAVTRSSMRRAASAATGTSQHQEEEARHDRRRMLGAPECRLPMRATGELGLRAAEILRRSLHSLYGSCKRWNGIRTNRYQELWLAVHTPLILRHRKPGGLRIIPFRLTSLFSCHPTSPSLRCKIWNGIRTDRRDGDQKIGLGGLRIIPFRLTSPFPCHPTSPFISASLASGRRRLLVVTRTFVFFPNRFPLTRSRTPPFLHTIANHLSGPRFTMAFTQEEAMAFAEKAGYLELRRNNDMYADSDHFRTIREVASEKRSPYHWNWQKARLVVWCRDHGVPVKEVCHADDAVMAEVIAEVYPSKVVLTTQEFEQRKSALSNALEKYGQKWEEDFDKGYHTKESLKYWDPMDLKPALGKRKATSGYGTNSRDICPKQRMTISGSSAMGGTTQVSTSNGILELTITCADAAAQVSADGPRVPSSASVDLMDFEGGRISPGNCLISTAAGLDTAPDSRGGDPGGVLPGSFPSNHGQPDLSFSSGWILTSHISVIHAVETLELQRVTQPQPRGGHVTQHEMQEKKNNRELLAKLEQASALDDEDQALELGRQAGSKAMQERQDDEDQALERERQAESKAMQEWQEEEETQKHQETQDKHSKRGKPGNSHTAKSPRASLLSSRSSPAPSSSAPKKKKEDKKSGGRIAGMPSSQELVRDLTQNLKGLRFEDDLFPVDILPDDCQSVHFSVNEEFKATISEKCSWRRIEVAKRDGIICITPLSSPITHRLKNPSPWFFSLPAALAATNGSQIWIVVEVFLKRILIAPTCQRWDSAEGRINLASKPWRHRCRPMFPLGSLALVEHPPPRLVQLIESRRGPELEGVETVWYRSCDHANQCDERASLEFGDPARKSRSTRSLPPFCCDLPDLTSVLRLQPLVILLPMEADICHLLGDERHLLDPHVLWDQRFGQLAVLFRQKFHGNFVLDPPSVCRLVPPFSPDEVDQAVEQPCRGCRELDPPLPPAWAEAVGMRIHVLFVGRSFTRRPPFALLRVEAVNEFQLFGDLIAPEKPECGEIGDRRMGSIIGSADGEDELTFGPVVGPLGCQSGDQRHGLNDSDIGGVCAGVHGGVTQPKYSGVGGGACVTRRKKSKCHKGVADRLDGAVQWAQEVNRSRHSTFMMVHAWEEEGEKKRASDGQLFALSTTWLEAVVVTAGLTGMHATHAARPGKTALAKGCRRKISRQMLLSAPFSYYRYHQDFIASNNATNTSPDARNSNSTSTTSTSKPTSSSAAHAAQPGACQLHVQAYRPSHLGHHRRSDTVYHCKRCATGRRSWRVVRRIKRASTDLICCFSQKEIIDESCAWRKMGMEVRELGSGGAGAGANIAKVGERSRLSKKEAHCSIQRLILYVSTLFFCLLVMIFIKPALQLPFQHDRSVRGNLLLVSLCYTPLHEIPEPVSMPR
ncbi:uncharacterized protein MYCFIDRAFT_209367 [Pseudocercospora fijiensis CIRAD86]|uniref:Uncharacterized protein n=1 Tax=Pseudocercospora fijiensis (strain CIRAD86) TaxID=383855 RepID=M2ZXY0_PSEFD|nr:uncharacterized protein MYCFIDRAFT_209367 [Pseudocercospora fijiensis CIRAD86]EME76976.1 hypothetical protein MYCFIDRAFT_209367 [Pseudocercospora fijiensis CIRAD86]